MEHEEIQLIYKGHPALSTISEPVNGEDVTELIDIMRSEMTRYGGIGIAANQVGVTKRVIIIRAKKFKAVMIDPVIARTWGQKIFSNEGCMSFPGVTGRMSRYQNLMVEYMDEEHQPVKRKLKGLAAIVCHHEIDHLNGITIDD